MTHAMADSTPKSPRTAGLHTLFEPASIAVIGVSRQPRGLGRRVFDALRTNGFSGPVYPITRDGREIAGGRSWPTASAVERRIDLAVIAVPRQSVLSAVDDCIAAGARAIIVITAGFAETGPEGRGLQDALVQKVRAAGVRLVGPNCMGVLNATAAHRMNASFSPKFPPPGSLALSSQSGALGIVIVDLASRRQVGMSAFASVGNKADVSGNDLLEYWEDDPNTTVIALYLESFGNPRRFAQIARRVARHKPIIAVKSGRTRAGAAAASSHTASLAASDVAVSALFHQTGVIRADTIDEMFDLAACFEMQPLPAGARVAIVTNAGGPGILAADACVGAGLTVVEFGERTRQRLASLLPSLHAVNPLDMIATAGPDQYREAIAAILAADEVDALMILYTPVDSTGSQAVVDAIGRGITHGRHQASRPKPVLGCLMGDESHPRLMAGAEQIPVYTFPENAARALGRIVRYARWRRSPERGPRVLRDIDIVAARELCQGVMKARGSAWLTDEEIARLLGAFGLAMTPSRAVHSQNEAVESATAIGFPVVAKLSSRAGMHKTEVGGVALNLGTPDEVAAAVGRMERDAARHGLPVDAIVIQPMITKGLETVVGIAHDRQFGALVGFGLGGVDVEALEDMQFRMAPLNDSDISEVIEASRAWKLMQARRGRPAADRAALEDVLARVARLAESVPEILELDLNPLIVLSAGHGCHIVDARARVGAADDARKS
ncbi:MAG TPA: acetate--CoA ligase family protein [Vicinamibacterales bacterium]|nr:acetate--CoA ligase family protein [Vicinamibacterales bacterium]